MPFDVSDERFGWGFDQGRAAPEAAAKPQASAPVPLSGLQSWEQLFGYEGGGGTLSEERAMRHGACYACVRLIAGTTAQLPRKVYKNLADGTSEIVPAHPLSTLLRLRPNPRMSGVMFWRMLIASAVLTGNGYAWIERNRNGDPVALWPIPKQRCTPKLGETGSLKGRLIYSITLDDGRHIVVDMDDMLHLPGSMQWNGLEATSPLRAAAASMNIALAADEFALRFMQNDATPPVVLKYGKTIGPDLAKQIKELWQTSGTGDNRGKVRIVPEGGEVDQLEMNLEDALLINTRKLSAVDIAMMFGVPPHMIGAIDKQTSWGSGIEQQSIGFITYTLQPHITAIEEEVEYKIFRGDGHHMEIDVRALLRADAKARSEAYRASLGGAGMPGYRTQNEVRKLENLPPHPDGDKLHSGQDSTANDEGTSDEDAEASEPDRGEREPADADQD